jgi:peptide/nickel transport system permease protein
VRTYVVKRLLVMPLTLLGVTLVTFAFIHLAPGDPSAAAGRGGAGGEQKGSEASIEIWDKWRKERHLDRPLPVQYVLWLRDLARGDLGRSFHSNRPYVWEMLAERIPITVAYNAVAFFIIYAVAIPLGVICGVKQFTLWDRAATVGVFLLYSLPSFWVATMLIYFFTTPDWPNFPVTGVYSKSLGEAGLGEWIVGWCRHGFLPVVCMSYVGFAFLSRQMRGAMLENIRQDFVRTARAKGLPERVVILKHALRNSLIPIVTLFGSLLPSMIAGSVIIEQIFTIRGMGMLFFEAMNERDYPVIMGELVVSGVLVMLGILISDLLYVLVNPTISYD